MDRIGGLLCDTLRGGNGYARKGMPFLHAKFGPKNYYKGTGARRMGYRLPEGGYKVLPRLIPQYLVPDLEGFELKPYVDKRTPRFMVYPPPVVKYRPLTREQFYHVMNMRKLKAAAEGGSGGEAVTARP